MNELKKIFKILALVTVSLTLTLILTLRTNASENQPINYLQYDEPWGSELYSAINSPSQTIAASGCGPTAMAMVLDYYINDNAGLITPSQTANFSLENNHRTSYQGTSWRFFEGMADEYNLDFMQTGSASEAYNWMTTQSNPLVICSMRPGIWTNGGHFILVWKILPEQNDEVYINDPNSMKQHKTVNKWYNVRNQCKQYFCFNYIKPALTPELMVLINNQNTVGTERKFFQSRILAPFSGELDFVFTPLTEIKILAK